MVFSETDLAGGWPERVEIEPGAFLLKALAGAQGATLLDQVHRVSRAARFRTMVTPGGKSMSVKLSNCGNLGWVSDRSGYRYSQTDPDTGRPWPDMPVDFRAIADKASALAGFEDFVPDACLVNRYAPGAGVTLHQDKNERDFSQPIVSVSLGVTARFLWGGTQRKDRTRTLVLEHGDVMVWGGPARMRYHGVRAITESLHPMTGNFRYNLTFRKAG